MRVAVGRAVLALVLAGASLSAQARKPFQEFTPTRCVIAERVMDMFARRAVPDTDVYVPGTDTLFQVVRDSLRMCQDAFGNATDDWDERLNFARTQLFTKQDSLAIATARRHMGTMEKRTPGERVWELYLIASDLMDARPARLAEFDSVNALLDGMGKVAATVRVLTHGARAQTAWVRYDDALVLKETNATIAAWKELDLETQMWRVGSLASAYMLRAELRALTQGGPAGIAVLDTALGVLPRNAFMYRQMAQSRQNTYQTLGKQGSKLEANYWFNTGEDGTNRPAPGKVSLIISAARPCTGPCQSMMRGIRRLLKHDEGKPIQVTFHTRTFGFYVDTAPASPFDEAHYDSTYFLNEVKIPGALGVFETSYSWRSDGRRLDAATNNQMNYRSGFVIVDKKGIIRYVGGWSSVLETRLTEFIDRLLAE